LNNLYLKDKKMFPWKYILQANKQRCNNPSHEGYKNYGGRGIECRITENELKFLWFRDNACVLVQPSIDRKNNDGHYEYSNCQFIELKDNVTKRNKQYTTNILQFDLDGNFIKEWKSITEASEGIGRDFSGISHALRNKQKTAYGFIWYYKK